MPSHFARPTLSILNRSVFDAATRGDAERMRACFGMGADCSHRAGQGFGVAYAAALGPNIECLRLLLSRPDPGLEARGGLHGHTALISAARAGRADSCALLLSGGARRGARDRDGLTALHHAIAIGHPACVRALADRASCRALDKEGRDALVSALTWAHARWPNQEAAADILAAILPLCPLGPDLSGPGGAAVKTAMASLREGPALDLLGAFTASLTERAAMRSSTNRARSPRRLARRI